MEIYLDTYCQNHSPHNAITLRNVDRAMIHRVRTDSQDLALKPNGVSIGILGLGVLPLLGVEGSAVRVISSYGYSQRKAPSRSLKEIVTI